MMTASDQLVSVFGNSWEHYGLNLADVLDAIPHTHFSVDADYIQTAEHIYELDDGSIIWHDGETWTPAEQRVGLSARAEALVLENGLDILEDEVICTLEDLNGRVLAIQVLVRETSPHYTPDAAAYIHPSGWEYTFHSSYRRWDGRAAASVSDIVEQGFIL